MLHACALSHVQLFVTTPPPRTVPHQAPLSMWFPTQEYWSGLPFPPPGVSSQARDLIGVSCGTRTGRAILYHWATWEAAIEASFICKYLSTWLPGRCAEVEGTVLGKNICGFYPRGPSWSPGVTAVHGRTGDVKMKWELGGKSWRLCRRNLWELSTRI